MITARDIYKSYGDVNVLKGVSLKIKKEEIVSIMGRSGAGKSTLLQIIGTLDHADKGTVIINGKTVSDLKKKQLASFRNETIGFVFQFHHLLPEFKAIENVMMPALIAGKSQADARNKAIELLKYLGISNRSEHKPSQLSGGEQQRVAIARALINRPHLVLADEPTGNLDTSSASEFHELLHKLRHDFGQTFLIVTHNPELSAMSDRTLTMEDGLFI